MTRRPAFFTLRRVKRIARISAGFFGVAFLLWAAFRAGFIPEAFRQSAEIAFNIALAISAVLMIYGVVAPVASTIHFNASKNEQLRSRVRNHALFRHFIIAEDRDSDA
ncbi:MAG TPA: hypothetical protein ENK45_02920 [Aliiroseovarius sp.]|nr:hypothetical protein [Aliiroseovarius sp.]